MSEKAAIPHQIVREIRQGGKRMWPPLETAALVQNWANGVLIGALVVGVVATSLVVWMGNVKEEYLKRDIAAAGTEAAKAKADAATANEGAAIAQQRAAEATLRAEEERLARVKIEERLAPRSITKEQRAELTSKLKPFSGTAIDILQIGESPEITNFRSMLEASISAAGWRPTASVAVGSGAHTGVAVGLVDATDEPAKAATRLLTALTEIGVGVQNAGLVKRENWPGFVMGPNSQEVNKAPIRLYVGSKP